MYAMEAVEKNLQATLLASDFTWSNYGNAANNC